MKYIPAVLVLVGISLCLFLSSRVGITYDEPPYLGFSWAYWNGGPGPAVREYPPVLSYLRGAVLLAAGAKAPSVPAGLITGAVEPHAFGQLFLFFNSVSPERLLFYGRLAGLPLLLILFFAVFRWSSKLGTSAPLFALSFAVLDPNLLAHGSLATTDAGHAAFFVLALFLWSRVREGAPNWMPLVAGVVAGLAIASKATGVLLLPIFAFTSVRPRDAAVAVLSALALAGTIYAPTGLTGLASMLFFRAEQTASPAPTWLFGRAWPEGHPLYFPAALLVKTTVPLLVLGLWGLFSSRMWKNAPERRRIALVGGAILLLAALAFRRQLGVRYVLPLYPLLCLGAGAAAGFLWNRGGRLRFLAAAMLAWHGISSLASLPHALAYSNELFGGKNESWRFVGDSNADWGQGLPDLKRFLDENPGGVILSYFGRDCPARVGIARQDAFSTPGPCPGSAPLPVEAEREWLVVSATKWQGFYESGKPAWFWLRDRTPRAVLGGSLFVYEVTKDASAHETLAGMYRAVGRPAEAAREAARARLLRKKETPAPKGGRP